MRTRAPRNPPGRFLTVIDLARSAAVPDHVVRFYARTGLIRATRQAANGYRQFVPFDVKRIRFIRAAQSLGFTLVEIREVMRRSRQHKTPCPLVREIIQRRLVENRERLQYVSALQDRIQHASEQWRAIPDEIPDGNTICALIEAVADETPAAPAGSRMARHRSFAA